MPLTRSASEPLLESGENEGQFRPEFEEYGVLLRVLGESEHLGCVLLTTRELPFELSQLEGERARARVLELGGFDQPDARQLLQDKHLTGDDAAWSAPLGRLR